MTTEDGATPIDADEAEGLIPDLTNRTELNQWEALNIARALEWVSNRGTLDPLSEEALSELHRQMFGDTWKWAGQLRRSDKSISPYHWTDVPRLVRELIANTKEQYATSDKTADVLHDIAMRFHHQLTRIHPWPNGNGRHARLATDLLLTKWGLPPFNWGGADVIADGEIRKRYISALGAADGWDYGPLREFLKS